MTAKDVPMPNHVCIIMDGNGRWAKKRFMPRTFGHHKGVETTRAVIEYFARRGVSNLTLFAFSSENWNRPEDEVASLMELFILSLRENTAVLNENSIRIEFIGERESFSKALQRQIAESERQTRYNQQMRLNIAANYGGQWDIVNACRMIAKQVAEGRIEADQIDGKLFSSALSLGDVPPPDLFIRTGGEMRISNFLLWHLAYTEFYFCDTLWPDFSETEMNEALEVYARRQRRYGKTGDQVVGA